MLRQANLPHRNPGDVNVWGRENGKFSLVIQAGYTMKAGQPSCIGLPYGSLPRLLLAWITTEAVKTKRKRSGTFYAAAITKLESNGFITVKIGNKEGDFLPSKWV